jgi:hypothetical protein
MAEHYIPTHRRHVGFYSVTGAGALQMKDLFTAMEHTGPQWWHTVAGIGRQEFWDRAGRTLVGRLFTILIERNDCHPDEQVEIRHEILHGHRPWRGDQREWGFADIVDVSRVDGPRLGRLVNDTVWVELKETGPAVATTGPDGLDCPDVELPPIDRMPVLEEPKELGTFRWTVRESDINGHVSQVSYLDRAENALADAGVQLTVPFRCQAWFKRPAFTLEETVALVEQVDEATTRVGFAGAGETRPRTAVEFRVGS